jgi:DNA-binding GntR family transcriptional regulator
MMRPGPISVPTVNDEVYLRLRQEITSGSLLPGAAITIRAIAENFGVSTQPVREALRKLEAESFVVFERRSVTVANLSEEELGQIFQIRLRLEQLGTEWAIGAVTDADLAELETILETMNDDRTTVEEWRRLNQEFHRRFYDCAHSKPLSDLLTGVWDKVEPYMAIYATSVDDFAEAHRQHVEILNLIKARDLAGLLARTEEHLAYTAQIVSRSLSNPPGPTG